MVATPTKIHHSQMSKYTSFQQNSAHKKSHQFNFCRCLCRVKNVYQHYGLVYWGLTPQQQPWSYRGGDDADDEMSVSLVDETGAPGNHRPTASN